METDNRAIPKYVGRLLYNHGILLEITETIKIHRSNIIENRDRRYWYE